MACTYCNMLMHGLCIGSEGDECCCDGKGFQSEVGSILSIMSSPRSGPKKIGEDMADPISTGRKRAAVRITDQFLGEGHPCSWAGLLQAGGGVRPIVGCKGNSATDRHHGPDKSVLNNDDALASYGTNLHAICDWCHNRWHALNDKYYVPVGWKSAKVSGDPRPEKGRPWLPNPEYAYKAHDPNTKASAEIIDAHEKWWALTTAQREGVNFYDRSEPAVSEGPEQSGPVGSKVPDADSGTGP